MARAKNKQELLNSSKGAFEALQTIVQSISAPLLDKPGVNGEWSVKDVLAHVHAWHELFFTWYEEGMSGVKPPMPAPGYSWKQTPALNEKIYDDYKDEPFEAVSSMLEGSFAKIYEIIQGHTDEELFTKKRYKWAGSTSMGSYLVSATASHYAWAHGLIKKWLKIQK